MEQPIDHMKYLPGMEVLEESTIMDEVITKMNAYDYEKLKAFNEQFNQWHDGQSSKKVCDILFKE